MDPMMLENVVQLLEIIDETDQRWHNLKMYVNVNNRAHSQMTLSITSCGNQTFNILINNKFGIS